MAKVFIKDREGLDEALRRFKRECEKCGIMQEIKKREFYESPSVQKKKKIQELKRKYRRKSHKSTTKVVKRTR